MTDRGKSKRCEWYVYVIGRERKRMRLSVWTETAEQASRAAKRQGYTLIAGEPIQAAPALGIKTPGTGR